MSDSSVHVAASPEGEPEFHLAPAANICALRTLGELHGLGVVDARVEHLSRTQLDVAARVWARMERADAE